MKRKGKVIFDYRTTLRFFVYCISIIVWHSHLNDMEIPEAKGLNWVQHWFSRFGPYIQDSPKLKKKKRMDSFSWQNSLVMLDWLWKVWKEYCCFWIKYQVASHNQLWLKNNNTVVAVTVLPLNCAASGIIFFSCVLLLFREIFETSLLDCCLHFWKYILPFLNMRLNVIVNVIMIYNKVSI